MNLDIDKDWFAKKAAQEGDLEIGAGMRKTLTVDLTPEEIALLERLIDPAKSDMRARIATLEAENQDLRSGSYLVGVIEERERLRRALEPFAKIGEAVQSSLRPDDNEVWGFNGAMVTYGDFRRAKKELDPKPR